MKPTKVLIVAVAMALACGPISGCTSIAAYEASHPYYRFPSAAVRRLWRRRRVITLRRHWRGRVWPWNSRYQRRKYADRGNAGDWSRSLVGHQ